MNVCGTIGQGGASVHLIVKLNGTSSAQRPPAGAGLCLRYCSSAATPRIAVAVTTLMPSESPTTDEIS